MTFPKKLSLRKLYRIKQQQRVLIGHLFDWEIKVWAYSYQPMMSIGCMVMPISHWLGSGHTDVYDKADIRYYSSQRSLSLPKLRKKLRVFYAYLRKALTKKKTRKPVRRSTRRLKRASRVPKSKASPRKRGALPNR